MPKHHSFTLGKHHYDLYDDGTVEITGTVQNEENLNTKIQTLVYIVFQWQEAFGNIPFPIDWSTVKGIASIPEEPTNASL